MSLLNFSLKASAHALAAVTGLSCIKAVMSDDFNVLSKLNVSAQSVMDTLKEFWELVGPGGKLHPAYFLEHKGHLVVEGLLISIILYLFLQASFKPKERNKEELTEKEIAHLVKEWEPEPLVASTFRADQVYTPPLVTGYDGSYAVVNSKRVLNLTSPDFLGFRTDASMQAGCRAAIEKYGVGSCGPRGFYGTIDVHLELEDKLAKFMGAADGIIYSYDIATVSSIIPAFASRMDTLVVDEHVSYPVQQGCDLSRAKVHFFKHNDMDDLERTLQRIDAQDKKEKKPLTRRFIIVEGVYANYGDMAPLDKICVLKEKYKYRLLVEESFSFGVMGDTGKGACEHFGLQPGQVEVICASMGTALSSVGGFCVGSHEIVDHQRLAGAGYCFSASLPPFLSVAAIMAVERMGSQARTLTARVQANAQALRRGLGAVPGLTLYGPPEYSLSPVLHLFLDKPPATRAQGVAKLQRMVDHAREQGGVMVCVTQYSELDLTLPPPSIKIYATAALTDSDISATVTAIKNAAKAVL